MFSYVDARSQEVKLQKFPCYSFALSLLAESVSPPLHPTLNFQLWHNFLCLGMYE